jgi:hypothetical protein
MDILRKYQGNSNRIYYVLLILMAMALPLSKFMIGICQVLLLINWICEGNFKEKIRIFLSRKGLMVFILIYVVLVFWFIFTDDYKLAIHELNFKLPFLEIALIIGTSNALSRNQIKKLLVFFIAGVIVASIISALSIFNIYHHHLNDYNDARESSLFIHHIRFSILVAIALIIMFYWFIDAVSQKRTKLFILLIPIAWLLFTLIFLKALTGLSVLIVASIILLVIYLFKIKNKILILVTIIVVLAIPFFSYIYIKGVVHDYCKVDKVDFSKLEHSTASGNNYEHDTLNLCKENGHFTMIYLCRKEIDEGWTTRSSMSIDSLDRKKQSIRTTLIRYLTSKGLRKDSTGLAQLTNKDIINVENGLANYIYSNNYSLYPRIYETIWEIDVYRKTGDANGHSLTQRFIYYKISLELIKEHYLLGVGTGDTRITYNEYYNSHKTGLNQKFQHESHNQFMRFLLEFGIFGFAIILFAFIYPSFAEKKWNNFYFLAIFIVTALSFLNEDAIESQVGTAMTAYFFSLFLFGTSPKED